MSSSTLQTLEQSKNDESRESPKGEYTIVEFGGEDDKWDKNFSDIKKWLILSAVTHGAVIVTCASSLYVFHPPLTVLILDRMLRST